MRSTDEIWSVGSTLSGHGEGLNDASWWRDSRHCATASDDKTVRLWDSETSQCLTTLRGHESYVFCVDVNPSNTVVASGSFDETIKFWDVRSGDRPLKTIAAHSDPVTGISFNKRDGTMIASSSYDGLLRLWDSTLGECLATIFAEHDGKTHAQQAAVSHCEYSPNGCFVLSANHDSTLRLWHVERPPCAHSRSFLGHEASRFCAACCFHAACNRRRDDPTKHAVVSGSEDGRLVVWNLQTTRLEHSISAHDDAVLAVSPHPTRDSIATGGMTRDSLVKIWDWRPAAQNDDPNRLDFCIQHEPQSDSWDDGRHVSALATVVDSNVPREHASQSNVTDGPQDQHSPLSPMREDMQHS